MTYDARSYGRFKNSKVTVLILIDLDESVVRGVRKSSSHEIFRFKVLYALFVDAFDYPFCVEEILK